MSRYDYPHRPPPTERWDGDRFARERGDRTVVAERDRYTSEDRRGVHRQDFAEDDYYSHRGPQGREYEDDHFYEREERYGPPARRTERKYYEEDDYEHYEPSPRRAGGRRPAPPRPGMLIRRQSSLDTFDRRPPPRYHEPEVITVPQPRRDRVGERHRYEPRYAEHDYYDEEDIRIAEPDRYGDDRFRGWKEREVETIRRRNPPVSNFEEVKEIEETEVIEEKPWPRRGKTRMSARLVNKRALVQLGYPYEDEFSEHGDFVIILKALNKELIDEVLELSKNMNTRTTLLIEETKAPGLEREIIEERKTIIEEPAEVPRSVRDWDVMSGTARKSEHGDRLSVHGSTAKSKHSRSRSAVGTERSKHSTHKSGHGSSSRKSEHISEHHSSHHSSHHGGHSSSSSSSSTETIKIKEKERSRSPVVIERVRSKSRRRSSVGRKTEVIDQEVGESNNLHTGPLALVIPHHRSGSRDERKIKDEIRELESEKRRLKRERRERKYHDGSDDEVIIERVRSGSHGRRDSTVKIEKDRRGGDSKIVRAMLGTLT